MRSLLSILLLLILWVPTQAQQVKKPTPCPVAALPFTTGELQDVFDTYNRQYWDGKLPKTHVIWTALSKRFGETVKEDDGSFTIKLDVSWNVLPNVAKTTLLHEMCHIKTWGESCHIGTQGDCTRWQRELHRIMLEGAFDDIV